MIDEWLYEYHSWRVSALLFPWNGVLKKIWGSWKNFQRFGGDTADISGRILFFFLFINTCSMTFVWWFIRLIVLCWPHSTALVFLGIAIYTDFLRSVGISPVSWIMFRSFVVSLIPNLPTFQMIFPLFEGLLNHPQEFVDLHHYWW